MSTIVNDQANAGYLIFKDRLKKLRKEYKLTQADVAKKLGLPRSTYSGYEKGAREAGYDVLVQVAQLFDISLDYLLGITDHPKMVTEKNMCHILKETNLHWNGIPLTEKDMKLIYDLLEKIFDGKIEKGS